MARLKNKINVLKKENFQIPKKWEYFIVKKNWIEWKILKTKSSWEITVFINWEEKVILNNNLWKQIDKQKWYYKESIIDLEENEFDKTISKLTIKQELFCQNYIKNDELRCNGTLAYNEAYWMNLDEKDKTRTTDEEWKEIYWTSEYDKTYNTCSVNSSKLLRLTKIQERNVELLNELLSEKKVDSRLAEIIFKWRDADSLQWIKIFNDLKKRVTNTLKVQTELNVSPKAQKLINKLALE